MKCKKNKDHNSCYNIYRTNRCLAFVRDIYLHLGLFIGITVNWCDFLENDQGVKGSGFLLKTRHLYTSEMLPISIRGGGGGVEFDPLTFFTASARVCQTFISGGDQMPPTFVNSHTVPNEVGSSTFCYCYCSAVFMNVNYSHGVTTKQL